LENLDDGVRIILKPILNKKDGAAWTAFFWLRIAKSGRLL
jgi:hypothetical protein